MSDTNEGTKPDGTQEKQAPTGEETKAPLSPEAKIAADKATANAKLLDGNGNPKSEEVLAAERAAEAEKATADNKGAKEQDDLKSKVTGRAKQVEDLIKTAGIDPASIIRNADPENGELSVGDKAKLIETHGEAIADLIEGNIQKIMSDTRKHGKAKDDAIFAQVALEFKGVTEQTGQESWTELAGWVKKNMAKDVRKEYNTMLAAGGIQAKLAVKEMVTAFKKDNDMTIPAELVEGDDAQHVAGKFITRSEYMKQLDVLRKAGHDYDTSPEIAKLNKLRERSMQSGK